VPHAEIGTISACLQSKSGKAHSCALVAEIDGLPFSEALAAEGAVV
jgi:hypothetical protein